MKTISCHRMSFVYQEEPTQQWRECSLAGCSPALPHPAHLDYRDCLCSVQGAMLFYLILNSFLFSFIKVSDAFFPLLSQKCPLPFKVIFFFFWRGRSLTVAQRVRNPPAVQEIQEMQVGSLSGEDPWRIQYSCLRNPIDRDAWQVITQSLGLQRVGHN